MLTIGRRWPTKKPNGDYQAHCDYCGAMWRRSQLRIDGAGLLACPDEGPGADSVTLDKINAANATRYRSKSSSRGGTYAERAYDFTTSSIHDLNNTWIDFGSQYSQERIGTLCYLGNDVVAAGTSGGGLILRSDDAGETWVSLGNQASETLVGPSISLGNGIGLMGTYPHGHVLRTTDYGATWVDLGAGPVIQITDFADLGNGVVYYTAPGGRVYRSSDWGATWPDFIMLGASESIYSVLYIGDKISLIGSGATSGKIFRIDDNGFTWSDLGQQAKESSILALGRFSDGTIIAGTYPNGKILRSTNDGISWKDLGRQYGQAYIRSIHVLDSDTALAGTGQNGLILYTRDRGLTWKPFASQFGETFIYSFANVGDIVMAGTAPRGKILRNADIGL
jgi:photosystem II stability/assembly factor-like uncharacterized protein